VSTRPGILRDQIASLGLLVAAFSMPLSVKVCHAGFILFLIAWIFEGQWRKKLTIISQSTVLQFTIGLLAVYLVALFYSDNITNGWLSVEKKIFFVLLPMTIATTSLKATEKKVRTLIWFFVAGCLTGSIVCLFNAIQLNDQTVINNYLSTAVHDPDISKIWMVFSYVSLAQGIGIHPAYFSLYIAFCIVFIFSELQKNHNKSINAVLWAIGVYFLIFLICLSSRIIIIGLSLILLLYIIKEIRYASNKREAWLGSGILMFMLIVLYVNPISRYRAIHEITNTPFDIHDNTTYNNSVEIRLSLWWLAAKTINESNFIAGEGTGDVKCAMQRTSHAHGVSNILNTVDPHNQFLYTEIELGLCGLVLICICLLLPLWFAWQARNYLVLSTLGLILLLCVTESALELQKGIAFCSLFIPVFLRQMDAFKIGSINMKTVISHARQTRSFLAK
jgi:O-antigen ligase